MIIAHISEETDFLARRQYNIMKILIIYEYFHQYVAENKLYDLLAKCNIRECINTHSLVTHFNMFNQNTHTQIYYLMRHVTEINTSFYKYLFSKKSKYQKTTVRQFIRSLQFFYIFTK